MGAEKYGPLAEVDMALFVMNYDLRKAREYKDLYAELNRFKAVRVLESMWCFNRFDTNCKGLREHFQSFVDADDGVFVGELSDWSTWNVLKTPLDL